MLKTLAARLETVLPQIRKDKVGFVKHWSSADNKRRILYLMWTNKDNIKPVVAILLDTSKAFERVKLSFYFTALSKFGMGDNNRRCILDQKLRFTPKT